MDTKCKIPTISAADLIKHAKDNPPKPLIKGLLYCRDVCVVHGAEECFKSMFVVQTAESISMGIPLLRHWEVPHPLIVGTIETEMNDAHLGERLGKMFPDGNVPHTMRFLPEAELRQWRRNNMSQKFEFLERWIKENQLKVLIVDIASDFFRGGDDPNKETDTGGMFDMVRNLPLEGRILVRHDRKHREGILDASNPNEMIRGSGEWKEDPEVILHLKREDRRTNEVKFEVGKMRYGQKPDPLTLWFDAGNFRLTPLPPVIAILESAATTRQELVKACGLRFNIGHTKADEMIRAAGPFLHESQRGHEKVFEIDRDGAREETWFPLLRCGVRDAESSGIGAASTGGRGSREIGDTVQDTEDSVTCTPPYALAASNGVTFQTNGGQCPAQEHGPFIS